MTTPPPTPPLVPPQATSLPVGPPPVKTVEALRSVGNVAKVLGANPTWTDPWFFTADNGVTYVVKPTETGDRGAFNELVFAGLARELFLNVPEVVAINVSKELVEDDVELKTARFPPGLHIGVARLPNGSIDLRDGYLAKLGSSITILNPECLSASVVYSSWIHDGDHEGNDGNWMLEPRENDRYIVWMIDFGHALGGPFWTGLHLQQLADPATVEMCGPHEVAKKECGNGKHGAILGRIDTITPQVIDQFSARAPVAWEPDQTERDQISTCLIGRRPGLLRLFPGGAP